MDKYTVWVKDKEKPATILKSYFVITPKGEKAIGVLLDPDVYFYGKKRRWMVNGDYYNAEVEYYYDESAELNAISLLREYEQWEADIISCDEMWWPKANKDALNGKIYEKMIELQSKRNIILNGASPVDRGVEKADEERSEFLNCVSKTRDKFVITIDRQDWNTEMRTAAEDLLIIYDQMKEVVAGKQKQL